MQSRKNILERVVHGADLSTEPTPAQPLVEIIGTSRVIIENHSGVTQYMPSCICVKVSFGSMRISGCGLEIAQMTKHRLVIIGSVQCVQLGE